MIPSDPASFFVQGTSFGADSPFRHSPHRGGSGLCCDAVARWEADHTKLDAGELVASITGPFLALRRAAPRSLPSCTISAYSLPFRSYSAQTLVKTLASEAEKNSDGSGDERFFDGAHQP